MRECPFCTLLVMLDDVGAYHEQPACEGWVAKMAELGANPAGPVRALVVHLNRDKGEAN
jgi:hypothetical protein